jgi:hypothetical protein
MKIDDNTFTTISQIAQVLGNGTNFLVLLNTNYNTIHWLKKTSKHMGTIMTCKTYNEYHPKNERHLEIA